MRFFLRLTLACAALNFGLAQTANTQDNADYRVTYIEVAPSATEQTAELLTSYAEASQGARGNQFFQALQRIGRANHFAILETWDSAETQTSHADSDYAGRFRDALEPLLLSPPDARPYSDLFTAEGASIGPDGVFVVTHVDVFPPYTDTTISLLNTLASASRSERGNTRFEVWSLIDHENHMTMVEAWESAEARERHSTASHTRAFRGGLSPFSGALYDERLYQPL